MCVCVWWKQMEINHKNTLINLTNKSLLIGWPDENEPCPFVKLLLKCDEYVVDVIARLDDDFWTVCAWMTWRAPPFDVIVCRMFICLCCECMPSDVWMFCDKLCERVKKNGGRMRDDATAKKGIMQFAKTRTCWRFQKRQFSVFRRISRHEIEIPCEIGRERDLNTKFSADFFFAGQFQLTDWLCY